MIHQSKGENLLFLLVYHTVVDVYVLSSLQYVDIGCIITQCRGSLRFFTGNTYIVKRWSSNATTSCSSDCSNNLPLVHLKCHREPDCQLLPNPLLTCQNVQPIVSILSYPLILHLIFAFFVRIDFMLFAAKPNMSMQMHKA